jgi:type I restriction enzyme, S subunit
MIEDLKPYPAYKDSGVPWLGEVPEHWGVRRGKTLFRCVDVRSVAGREELLTVSSERGVVPRRSAVVTMFRAESYAGHKLCWPGDLVINSLWAWARGLGVSRLHGIVSTAYGVYRPRVVGDINPWFVHELVRSTSFHWELLVRSKGVWKSRLQLTDESFLGSPFPVPPLAEQASIVRFLDHADRRIRRYIRAKQKLIKLLEEQKQAIIHRAVTRGLDPNVRLKPSGIEWLGNVPEHWEVNRLKYVSPEITVGVVVNPSSYFVDSGVPMLLGNNVLPGRFKLDNVRRISTESNRVLEKSQLHAGDVVVVRVGAPGVAAVVPDELDGCNCASMVIVRRGRGVEPRWIQNLFNSPVMRRQIDVVKYGAAQKQFNIAHAVEFRALVPSIEEQREILDHLSNEMSALDMAAYRVTSGISLLREYLTRLIADVVTGKLDVREAAARLPDEPEEPDVLEDAGASDESDESGEDADQKLIAEEEETNA